MGEKRQRDEVWKNDQAIAGTVTRDHQLKMIQHAERGAAEESDKATSTKSWKNQGSPRLLYGKETLCWWIITAARSRKRTLTHRQLEKTSPGYVSAEQQCQQVNSGNLVL